MATNENITVVNDAKSSDEKYFSSYEDLEVHRLMLKDEPRTKAYKNAILQNEHLFKGKIVMDVGSGTGILSLMMAKAGAAKVYSIEASSLAENIPNIAEDNGFSDQIKVFHCPVENFSLPEGEKVDVIVSEWMGFYLFHESMFSSVIYARDHFLSEEGIMFPSEARLYACPCSLQDLYDSQFYFWNDVYGFNLSRFSKLNYRNKQTKPEICDIKSSDLLADPVCIKKFNLRYVSDEEVDSFSCVNFTGITKSGIHQGLAIWFVCDFDGVDYNEQGEEFGTLVQLSTSPFHIPTHWKQTVIIYGPLRPYKPLDNSRGNKVQKTEGSEDKCTEYDVEEHEVVGWKLDFIRSPENSRHYNIILEMLDPETETHPTPCSCPVAKCMIIAKMLENEGEVL